MKQFIAKHLDNDPRHIARMLSSSEEGKALITTIPPTYPDLRFPADGAMYVHALRTRLGLPIIGLREGPCHCGSKAQRGHCDVTGYHCSVCKAKGQESGIQATHKDGKQILVAMCIEAGYKVATESSDSTRHNDPECRKRTDITVYVDGVSVDDLDYGVTDVRIGYLGSKNGIT